jgi:SAM-dependent methyltransferase
MTTITATTHPLSEARFSIPRSECPNPEYWTSDDVDSTEHQVSALVAAFVIALQPELVLETGTAYGQTAQLIGQALKQNGHGRLITLETTPSRVMKSRARCEGLPVDCLQVASTSYLPSVDDPPLDFVWFDSLLHLRHIELLRFRPYMSERCVVGFHDTAPRRRVRKHLNELEADGHLVGLLHLPTPRGVTFARIGSVNPTPSVV